jgi:squalene-hopene/tetraprenyl-beta-curcumene cyclase
MSWRRSRLVVRFLETRMHDGIQMLVLQLAAISRSLTGEWPRQAPEADARALYDLLDRYQNPDGSVCGFVPIHGLALAALHAAGDRGPRTRRGIAWLRSRLTHAGDAAWFTAYDPDIWVTGITMRALRTAGVPADDPAIRAGARWLLRGQSFRPLTRTPQRRTGVTRVGGWGFGADNVTMPDTDDTGIALLALGGVAGEAGVDAAIEAGADWLVTMQNPDGGFPAFSWNVGTRPTGRPVYLRAGEAAPLRKRVAAARAGLAILADTANEDLVARVLDALCALPRTPATQRAIDGAIAWLRSFQLEDGSFIGKWVTPYLTTTSDVLRGLRAAGLLAEDPMVRRALAWLVSKQRPDGGWGETHETAFDPSLVGQQPSLAPTTAWVLSGLIPWLGPDDPVIARGVTWLLDAQAEDGTWDNGRHTHVYLPPDRTYVLPATPAMHGLEALARWRRATR